MPGVDRVDEAAAQDEEGLGPSDRVPAVRRKVGLLVGLFVLLQATHIVLGALLQDHPWAVPVQQVSDSMILLLAVGLGVWASRRLERDAAERRRAEREMLQHQERLQEVVENSTNLFYSHDTAHRLTYVSPQTRSFFDCEPEEALVHWTDFVTDHPINQRGIELTERAIATGKRQPVYELELRGLRGRTIWVEVNEAPMVRDGRTVGIVGALTDVTERKRAEEERERLKERLRLGQKLEAIGRLAGGVAHDFNNLLTAILGYGDLLAERLGPDHAGTPELEEIRRAGERASSLISQLLAFSRKQVIEPRTIDLRRLVEDSARMVRRLIPEDVELELDLGEQGAAPVLVTADPNQIEQLLVNLAVNARDAMPSGGRLSVAISSIRLESGRRGDLFEVVPGDYALLEVHDTGQGMDRETLEHAFEPFYTTKGPGEGTGLGLATVYGIVKQNRGYVWVDSRPGRGATFSIYLPSAPATEAEPRAGRKERAAVGDGHVGATVLLVEDETAVRSLVREVLLRQGYEVLEASNAREALELSAGRLETIDLLLTDLVMPGLSGADLGRELQEAKPDLAVIYITGYSEGALNARGLLGSDYRLLLKPFKAADLLDRVAEVVEPRRATPTVTH
jgi:PAS domain S-box-containing protein